MRIVCNQVGQYLLYGARRDKSTRAMLTLYGWHYCRPFDRMPSCWGLTKSTPEHDTVAAQTAAAFGITVERR